MSLDLRVFEIPPERRYWVIRPGRGGAYFKNFKRSNIVAIGHADEISLPDPSDLTNAVVVEALLGRFTEFYKNSSQAKSRLSNLYGQVRRFIVDIKVDDIVITVTPSSIVAGRVLSPAYVSNESSVYDIVDSIPVICDYKLKRTVVWGRECRRDRIPYELENSLHNPSAVFEISNTDKVSILNHWLSPIHTSDGSLHLSSKIEKEELIGNRPVTQFSALLDKVELVSKRIADAIEEGIEFKDWPLDSFLNDDGYEYVLTTKQAFMSPGDHFTQLKAPPLQRYVFALIFANLFTANITFANEDFSHISDDQKQSILVVANRFSVGEGFEKIRSNLKLEMKEQDERVVETEPSQDDKDFPENESTPDVPI